LLRVPNTTILKLEQGLCRESQLPFCIIVFWFSTTKKQSALQLKQANK